jgi:PAS domain-containing protein
MYRIYGLDPKDGPPSLADWLRLHVHPQDQARLSTQAMQIDAAVQRGDALIEATFRIHDSREGERWVQTWTRRVLRDGRRLSYGMHMDVSARHSAEARAQHERQRTQLAIDAAGVGIWERDAQGAVSYWNEAMYRLRGLQPDDPRSPDQIMRDTLDPSDHEHLLAQRRQHCRASTLPARTARALALGPVALAGHRRPRAARRAGPLLGMAGVNYDVTERKLAEDPATREGAAGAGQPRPGGLHGAHEPRLAHADERGAGVHATAARRCHRAAHTASA